MINYDLFLEYLRIYVSPLSEELEKNYRKDSQFAAELDIWWADNKVEHPGSTCFQGAAQVIIVNWMNRFLFAHYLKKFHNAAGKVETIKDKISVSKAIEIFNEISLKCDFMNIFGQTPGQSYIDDMTWNALLNLNALLNDFKLETVSQQILQQILEGAVSYSRKKIAGQFSTPKPLAAMLVRLCIKDRTKNVIDPCCGTGTVVRAAYELKKSIGIDIKGALETVWGSDKFAFPLQLCTMALSDPLAIGQVVQVFRDDVFILTPGKKISFIHPDTGGTVVRKLPEMHAVISNLPFVWFESNEITAQLIERVKKEILEEFGPGFRFSERADLYAYILIHIRHIIEIKGRVGVITSNSWLGTAWGRQLREILIRYFKMFYVVLSGNGRWFHDTEVVTTILVLEKRDTIEKPDRSEIIQFLTTTERIETWEKNRGGIEEMTNRMLISSAAQTGFVRRQYSQNKIEDLENYGFGWTSLFVDLNFAML